MTQNKPSFFLSVKKFPVEPLRTSHLRGSSTSALRAQVLVAVSVTSRSLAFVYRVFNLLIFLSFVGFLLRRIAVNKQTDVLTATAQPQPRGEERWRVSRGAARRAGLGGTGLPGDGGALGGDHRTPARFGASEHHLQPRKDAGAELLLFGAGDITGAMGAVSGIGAARVGHKENPSGRAQPRGRAWQGALLGGFPETWMGKATATVG